MGNSYFKSLIDFLTEAKFDSPIKKLDYEYEKIITSRDFSFKSIERKHSDLSYLKSKFRIRILHLNELEEKVKNIFTLFNLDANYEISCDSVYIDLVLLNFILFHLSSLINVNLEDEFIYYHPQTSQLINIDQMLVKNQITVNHFEKLYLIFIFMGKLKSRIQLPLECYGTYPVLSIKYSLLLFFHIDLLYRLHWVEEGDVKRVYDLLSFEYGQFSVSPELIRVYSSSLFTHALMILLYQLHEISGFQNLCLVLSPRYLEQLETAMKGSKQIWWDYNANALQESYNSLCRKAQVNETLREELCVYRYFLRLKPGDKDLLTSFTYPKDKTIIELLEQDLQSELNFFEIFLTNPENYEYLQVLTTHLALSQDGLIITFSTEESAQTFIQDETGIFLNKLNAIAELGFAGPLKCYCPVDNNWNEVNRFRLMLFFPFAQLSIFHTKTEDAVEITEGYLNKTMKEQFSFSSVFARDGKGFGGFYLTFQERINEIFDEVFITSSPCEVSVLKKLDRNTLIYQHDSSNSIIVYLHTNEHMTNMRLFLNEIQEKKLKLLTFLIVNEGIFPEFVQQKKPELNQKVILMAGMKFYDQCEIFYKDKKLIVLVNQKSIDLEDEILSKKFIETIYCQLAAIIAELYGRLLSQLLPLVSQLTFMLHSSLKSHFVIDLEEDWVTMSHQTIVTDTNAITLANSNRLFLPVLGYNDSSYCFRSFILSFLFSPVQLGMNKLIATLLQDNCRSSITRIVQSLKAYQNISCHFKDGLYASSFLPILLFSQVIPQSLYYQDIRIISNIEPDFQKLISNGLLSLPLRFINFQYIETTNRTIFKGIGNYDMVNEMQMGYEIHTLLLLLFSFQKGLGVLKKLGKSILVETIKLYLCPKRICAHFKERKILKENQQ